MTFPARKTVRVPSQHVLAVTRALLDPDTAVPAAEALAGSADRPVVEGLVVLLLTATAARSATAALAALHGADGPLVRDALVRAAAGPFATVRLAAVRELHRRSVPTDDALERRLRTDPSWQVRRAALAALADRRRALVAADDPHWRVRHALVADLVERSEVPVLGDDPRSAGVRAYLRWRLGGERPAAGDPPEPPRPPFWDWDPAVLARDLDRLGPGRRAHLDWMPALLGHDDERVRSIAVEALAKWGTARHLAEAFRLLGEPRSEAVESVERLVKLLDQDRLAEAGYAPPPAEPAAAPYPDDHPFIRASALTPEWAAELMADPIREMSWHVLAAAAKLARVPLWAIDPDPPWRPPARTIIPAEPLAVRRPDPPHTRFLGTDRIPVAPVGISGHYGLPVEGFAAAVEAGVNLLFWEPNYQTLTDFAGRLSASDRRGLHFVAGTFTADGRGVVRDAERALKSLKVERLSLFLVFWVQSWRRISDDVRAALDELKSSGQAAMVGLSTHSRPLAVEAMASGWNPVMVRHSAAHRGAEAEVFPATVAHGVGLLTFNATCYGRLLKPYAGRTPPSAADCYRYSLAQPGVSVCWSAPATVEQLADALAVLRDPTLPDDRRRSLETFGAALYEEETIFRRLIRQR